MSNSPNIYIMVEPAQMVFSHLFQPVWFDEQARKYQSSPAPAGKKAVYDMTVMLPATGLDFQAVKKIVGDLAAAQLPAEFGAYRQAVAAGQPASLLARLFQLPWETGEDFIARTAAAKGERARDNEFMRGHVLLKASSIYPPLLDTVENGSLVKHRDAARGLAEPKFYPGVRVVAELNFQHHKVGTNTPGVTAYVNEIISTNTGDRIAGGKPTEEKFTGYLGNISAIDPTAGQAAAMPW